MWRPSCGLPGRGVHGGICPRSSVCGTRYSDVLRAGLTRACGLRCSRHWPRMQISRGSSWTRPSFAPINIPQAHPKKGEQALGRSRGGLSTKIHALVEGLGHLARFELTPGQAGDVKRAADLLEGLPVQTVMADTACDAAHLIINNHAEGALFQFRSASSSMTSSKTATVARPAPASSANSVQTRTGRSFTPLPCARAAGASRNVRAPDRAWSAGISMESHLKPQQPMMKRCRAIIEYPIGNLKKCTFGNGQFLFRGLHGVRGAMALVVLAHNIKRMSNILGIPPLRYRRTPA